jgi:hypothetical protein
MPIKTLYVRRRASSMTENRKRVFGTKRIFIFVGIILLVCAGGLVLLSRRIQPDIFAPGEATVEPVITGLTQQPVEDSDKYKIGVELSEDQSQPQKADLLPATNGESLSAEEIALILSRLPALTVDPDQQTEFKLPQEILPPPQPGNTIEESFPPLEAEPTTGLVDAGPLQVLRFAPEGEIPIAPFVSVTFNQPMVPLGTLGDLTELDVPVKIEPSLPGTWR